MPVLAVLLALIAAQAPAPRGQAAPVASAQPLAASPSAPPGEGPTPEGLEELRHAYHDSCEVRLYGEYDDMCSDLSDQIRRYRAALARVARARPRS